MCFTAFGFITYYIVPMSILAGDVSMFIFIMLSILFIMIVGMTFIAQLFVPIFEHFFLDLSLFFRPQDQRLRPLIKQYLKSHQKSNLRASMMYTITITFLMYMSTSITQISYMLFSVT